MPENKRSVKIRVERTFDPIDSKRDYRYKVIITPEGIHPYPWEQFIVVAGHADEALAIARNRYLAAARDVAEEYVKP